MPAAVAIPAIIGAAGAGASLVGAKMASNASKDAAKLQIQATDKAQQFNERVYADQKQLMDPYVKGGTEAFQRLMAQHWGTAVPAGLPPSTGGANAFLGQQAQMTMPRPPAGPPAGSLAAAQAGGGPQGQPMQAPPMQPGAPPQGGGQMVMMVGPDGSQKAIPAANVAEAERRGAKRLN